MHARGRLTDGSHPSGRCRVRGYRFTERHVGDGAGRQGRSAGCRGPGAEHSVWVRPDRGAVGQASGDPGRDRGPGPLRALHRRLPGAGLGPVRCRGARGADVDDLEGTRRTAGQGKAEPVDAVAIAWITTSPGLRSALEGGLLPSQACTFRDTECREVWSAISSLTSGSVVSDQFAFSILVLVVAAVLIAGTFSSRLTAWLRIPAPALFLIVAAVVALFLPAFGPAARDIDERIVSVALVPVSYTHLRAHETDSYLVC